MVVDQRAGAGGLEVPDTVHGVLTARIDRLAEIPKRLVQTAAVLGREFPLRLLQAMEPELGRSASDPTWQSSRGSSSSTSGRKLASRSTSSSTRSPRTSRGRRS